MEYHTPRDHATSNVLAWTATHSANVEPSVEEDAGADADEPPDCPSISAISTHFQRSPIRRGSEHHESLLTKAFQNLSDDEANDSRSLRQPIRRRSVTSTTSLASTVELTCGTGITTPARTTSPSPRLPDTGFVPFIAATAGGSKDPAIHALEKKRCISFACAAKPNPDGKASVLPPPPVQDGARVEEVPKKTSIKFACLPRPPKAADVQQRGARPPTPVPRFLSSTPKGSPGLEKRRSSSTVRAFRSLTPRRSPGSPAAACSKKWLTADLNDLESECVRFHEFASDEPQEDDWIRRDDASSMPKLTIDDTLEKENAIRKLGKEAEEEADLEEELDEEEEEEVEEEYLIDDEDGEDDSIDADDGDNLDDEIDEEETGDGLDDDADTEYRWDDEASDGYKTDNETGFADSDDEDDGLVLWSAPIGHHWPVSGAASVSRRLSPGENSDSSAGSNQDVGRLRRKKGSRSRAVPFRPPTPELPDSTDFVCGTLDEDKPLEEAYISCVEARKRDNHQLIPQDIDPSFPTSEPEDEAEELYRKEYGESDDHLWLHGELEDLHHDRDRRGRRKGSAPSPRRCRSPPPKRRPSPAPKTRGRSPRKHVDQHSPRKLRSPAPPRMTSRSPLASPVPDTQGIAFKTMGFQPNVTQTKSLPRARGMFPHLRARKHTADTTNNDTHVRGAIDIVKGLEQKRQRRKEKFYQKYYNRARKEKAHVRRPPPGQGAERMRELGLFMAGKAGGHGNYVLSI
ncbi:hypothetical protein MMYC01_207068 [Madurella mycetomatis]|uniref:Uncharacterized protein n=1 Tax=Madurella mycetomatis TaxID=100816 RepID=A0A175VZD6_9PEZI|nr:hypothetical protein MMYC01_207068 [Madurella mycetomatis]